MCSFRNILYVNDSTHVWFEFGIMKKTFFLLKPKMKHPLYKYCISVSTVMILTNKEKPITYFECLARPE